MSYDEKLILEFLAEFEGEFISPMDIAKRAAGRTRYKSHPGWARVILQRLEQQCILEQDRHGYFRIKEKRVKADREVESMEEASDSKPAEPARAYHYWLGPSVVEADDDQPFAKIFQYLAVAWPSTTKKEKSATPLKAA